MKNFLIIFLLFVILSSAKAQNTNITLNSDLSLNCKFEKVILKNPDHNFVSFTKDQIKRKDINKLIIESKTPDVLSVKNLSEFFNKIDLEVKILNKDIFLIQAFDKERNLEQIIKVAQNKKIKIILAGMVAPDTHGEKYKKDFDAIYPKLSKKYNLALIPFLLEGVALNPSLNQQDGIHPNKEGTIKVSETIKKSIISILN